MIESFFLLAVALFVVVRSAGLATKYAARLAEDFRLSKYVVGFLIVAVISILPETFISVNSALKGIPEFGLGTLFGSNVADLTLVFVIIIAVAGRGIKVESKILKNNIVYPFLLLVPLILGLNGHYSRLEGAALVITGAAFYFLAFRHGHRDGAAALVPKNRFKNFLFLLISMALLLAGAHFTVLAATDLAYSLKINPVLIGMLIVGLGTTMPELFFSLKSVKKHDDSLAVGDILGTVLADATVVVGILALISPFSFPQRLIYVTGAFMVMASFLLFYCLRTGKVLSKKESILLFIFWVIFVFTEFLINN